MERTNYARPLVGSTVLVTGGTGFTGKNLIHKLVDAGVDVRGIARESSKIEPELQEKVTWFRGDVYDPAVVHRAAHDIEYIFHLAACFRDPSAPDNEYWKVHVKSTQLLAEAVEKQPAFQRFIHTSTIGVHGHIEDPPADEEAPYNPGDQYQKTKLEGERWIRNFSAETGLPLVVIRPAAIMGPTDRRLLKLFKFAKHGFFPLLDGHDTRYHLIHVDDLTDCMLLATQHLAAEGEVFICGNDRPTSVVEMLTVIGEMLNRKVRFVSIPSAPLFALADAMEWGAEKLNVEPILYRRRVAFFTKDRAFDTTKIQQKLNFDYQYDNKSGIRNTAQGYMDAGWL
jgi:nucleoside-diphosphate-sugar epimerase